MVTKLKWILSKELYLITLLSIISSMLCYNFESGFAKYFEYPSEMIKIDIYQLIRFSIIVFAIIVIPIIIAYCLEKKINKKMLYHMSVLVSALILIIIIITHDYIITGRFLSSLISKTTILILVIGGILGMLLNDRTPNKETPVFKLSIYPLLIVLYCILLNDSMKSIGYIYAIKKETFYTYQDDNKEFAMLTKYGDSFIVKEITNGKINKKVTRIVNIDSLSDKDIQVKIIKN
jgi:hypothetical protein